MFWHRMACPEIYVMHVDAISTPDCREINLNAARGAGDKAHVPPARQIKVPAIS